MSIELKISKLGGQVLTKQVLSSLLMKYKRPLDKIHELVKEEKLETVKRGLYIPGAKSGIARPEPFLIANHLAGPSYVSFETALSYWGLIPEKINEISSATISKSKLFRTKSGRFRYIHSKLPYYSYGIQQVELAKNQWALVASPEKALCDKIIQTAGLQLRSSRQAMQVLVQDFRIEKSSLKSLDVKIIESWYQEAPKKDSIKILIKTLQEL